MGKKVAKDGAAGKATLVGLLGTAEARRRLDGRWPSRSTAIATLNQPTEALAEAARFMASRRS